MARLNVPFLGKSKRHDQITKFNYLFSTYFWPSLRSRSGLEISLVISCRIQNMTYFVALLPIAQPEGTNLSNEMEEAFSNSRFKNKLKY